MMKVAPGLFSANASGAGAVAVVALRVRADGSQSVEGINRFDAQTGRFVSVPIDLGPEGEQVFLILFGSGFRGRNALEAVTASSATKKRKSFSPAGWRDSLAWIRRTCVCRAAWLAKVGSVFCHGG